MTDSNREKMNKAILKGVEDTLEKVEGEYDSMSEKATEAFKSFKEKAGEAYGHAKDKAVESKEKAEKYVSEHPEKSLMIAVGVGALTALLAVWLMKKERD